jgi:hypothetical protein
MHSFTDNRSRINPSLARRTTFKAHFNCYYFRVTLIYRPSNARLLLEDSLQSRSTTWHSAKTACLNFRLCPRPSFKRSHQDMVDCGHAHDDHCHDAAACCHEDADRRVDYCREDTDRRHMEKLEDLCILEGLKDREFFGGVEDLLCADNALFRADQAVHFRRRNDAATVSVGSSNTIERQLGHNAFVLHKTRDPIASVGGIHRRHGALLQWYGEKSRRANK